MQRLEVLVYEVVFAVEGTVCDKQDGQLVSAYEVVDNTTQILVGVIDAAQAPTVSGEEVVGSLSDVLLTPCRIDILGTIMTNFVL